MSGEELVRFVGNITLAPRYSNARYCSTTCFEQTVKGNWDECRVIFYDLGCGKQEGTDIFSREVTVYSCKGCDKTNTYKHADRSYCTICNGYHSISASGTQGL